MIRFRNLTRNLHVLQNTVTQRLYTSLSTVFQVIIKFWMITCSLIFHRSLPVLARVQVKFTDAVVKVNYRTLDYSQEYFLKIRMKR